MSGKYVLCEYPGTDVHIASLDQLAASLVKCFVYTIGQQRV